MLEEVWIVSPEMFPFAKTGGLGDVIGYLPRALVGLGLKASVVIPYYWVAERAGKEIAPFASDLWAPIGDKWLGFDVCVSELKEDLRVFLIKREDLYMRPNLYRGPKGDYYDNLERYSFFCHAFMRFFLQQKRGLSVIHCNDWQTGLIPAIVRSGRAGIEGPIKTVFTVHNVAYQGLYPGSAFFLTGLDPAAYFHKEGFEFWGNLNMLKGGVLYADRITTVSPTHAEELKDPSFARGLEGVFQKRAADLTGILNGVDYSVWDPMADPLIPAAFGPQELSGKAICKEALKKELGLTGDPSIPLFCMVTRLDSQKGIYLVLEAMEEIMGLGVNFALLGEGDEGLERSLEGLMARFPTKIALRFGMDEGLAHRMIAGADVILIPSLFEPCGLTQMYALRYGTIPVARRTGGLADTIVPYDPNTGRGNGILFDHYNKEGLLWGIREALGLYREKDTWQRVIKHSMEADYSWEKAARAYLSLYEGLWN